MDFSFQIFPNPATNQAIIDIGESQLQNGKVNIYNAMGQLVYSHALRNDVLKKTLDLTGLQEGTYFVQLLAEGVQAMQMLQIVR